MNEKDLNSLKESIDTLIDENERLRKRIEALEAEKVEDISNNFEEQKKFLDEYLKEIKVKRPNTYLKYPDYHSYQRKRNASDHIEENNPDWSYIPERDELDWSYRPKRGTFPPEVGDWPPAPQIGDFPPYRLPDDYPYPYWPYPPYGAWWGIYPPYWQFPGRNYVTTNGTGNPARQDVYTTSKTEE